MKPNIIRVIESRAVQLRNSGKEYLGRCPFHPDKTPSFSVNAEKGLFHCFGCQASGDVFDFIMQLDQCTFAEAASTLGVKKSKGHRKLRGPSREARQITTWANSHFLLAQAVLREINKSMRLAQEIGWREEIDRLCREYQILETVADDLQVPATAVALYRDAKAWVENLLADSEEEPPETFPDITSDYLTRLRAYTGGDA